MNILDLRRPLQMFQDNYQIKIRVALLNNILDKSRVNFETFSTIHEIVSLWNHVFKDLFLSLEVFTKIKIDFQEVNI